MAGPHKTTALYDLDSAPVEAVTSARDVWTLDAVGPDGEHQSVALAPGRSAGFGRDPVADPPVDVVLTADDDTVSAAHLRVRVSRDGHAFVNIWQGRPTNRLYMNGREVLLERQASDGGALLKAGRTYLVLSRRPGVVLNMVCHSRAMRVVAHHAMKCGAAPKQLPVLIVGETGTGKTELAALLHKAGQTGSEKLVERVLSEQPRDLVAKAIFGSKENAATSTAAQDGAILTAGAGTLFLDEISELSLEDQTRLLRPVRARYYQRIGEDEDRPVRCRFVFATNRDLEAEVKAGRFRHDLYHRIRGLRLEIPPLRERREDITALVDHLLDRVRREDARPWAPPSDRGAEDVRKALQTRVWEGNIGELYQVVLLACALESFREALDLSVREGAAPSVEAGRDGLWPLDPRAPEDLRSVDEIKLAYCRRAAEIAVRTGHHEDVARRLGYGGKESFRRRLDDWKIKPDGW